jgi:tRNA 5-methylaminomethyl-2-thiouridine biosynthesis bifunctional protein
MVAELRETLQLSLPRIWPVNRSPLLGASTEIASSTRVTFIRASTTTCSVRPASFRCPHSVGSPGFSRLEASATEKLITKRVTSLPPEAGVLDPIRALKALSQRSGPQLRVELEAEAVRLSPRAATWEVELRDGRTVRAEHVVIAASHQATQLSQTAWLPLEPIRGEVWLMAGTEPFPLRVPIAASSYFIPQVDGRRMLVGATYRHNDLTEAPEPEGWRALLARAEGVPPFANLVSVSSRVSFRASTHDRLPYIGAVPNFESALAGMNQKRSGSKLIEALPYRNLWISAGHGSRGFSSAPLAAAILADQIGGASEKSAHPVDPSRAVHRLLVAQSKPLVAGEAEKL